MALLNWTTGEGTAKYWASKLLIDTVQIDRDQAVLTNMTDLAGQYIYSQAFIGDSGRRWVLIVNKRYANIDVVLPESTGARMQMINEASGFGPPTETTLTSDQITLTPFAIAVVHLAPIDDLLY